MSCCFFLIHEADRVHRRPLSFHFLGSSKTASTLNKQSLLIIWLFLHISALRFVQALPRRFRRRGAAAARTVADSVDAIDAIWTDHATFYYPIVLAAVPTTIACSAAVASSCAGSSVDAFCHPPRHRHRTSLSPPTAGPYYHHHDYCQRMRRHGE